MVSQTLKFLVISAFMVPGGFSAAQTVRVDHRVFPDLHVMDGNWAALTTFLAWSM